MKIIETILRCQHHAFGNSKYKNMRPVLYIVSLFLTQVALGQSVEHAKSIDSVSKSLLHFMSTKIKSLSIGSVSSGCFHENINNITYQSTGDSTLSTSCYSVFSRKDTVSKVFSHSVRTSELLSALRSIVNNPLDRPTMRSFELSDSDITNYKTRVCYDLQTYLPDTLPQVSIDTNYLYAVPSFFDTLNVETVEAYLKSYEEVISTETNYFLVQAVNQSDDTLTFSTFFHGLRLPWNAPWVFRLNTFLFESRSIGISRFIYSCLPEKFVNKHSFDNGDFIMWVASDLWLRKVAKR